MLGAATLVGLVLYPILFGLPTVSLLYTLLDPAFDSSQEKIEAADERRTQICYFALTFIVVALSIASHLTPSLIGFTKANWQMAVALGALVSSLPLALSALLNRLQTAEQRLADPLRHGSLMHRCAMLVLGSVAIEVWRAFCVASMLEMGFPAFICILVVAFVYGIPSLATSVARAMAAAAFGCVAGLLFVTTKSILAPLTLSLISASAELYLSRFSPLEVSWNPGSTAWGARAVAPILSRAKIGNGVVFFAVLAVASVCRTKTNPIILMSGSAALSSESPHSFLC